MIQRLKSKSEFSRNVLTLMTGTTIAQAIPIAISPILTRIYTPEDFGILALYVAVTTIISIVVTGKYELAITLPRKEEDAINIVALSVAISFFVSFIVFFIVILFNSEITQLLGNPEISNWLYFVPISILLTGVYQSFNFWSNRKKKYRELAISRVTQSGTSSISSVSIGFFGFVSAGLIAGQVIGNFIATLVLGNMIWRKDKNKFSKIKKIKIIELAKRYIDHPKFLIYSYGISSVYAQIPVFFIGRIFDLTTLGFFSLANKFVNLPVVLIANALGDVFRQKATEEYHNTGRFDRLVIKTLKYTFFIAIVPFSLFFFWSPDIFAFVFGETWRVAGEYAQILTISAFFSFVITPIDKAALITNRMSYIYKWHTVKFIFYSVWAVMVYYLDVTTKEFIFGLVLINILFYLVELFFEHKFSKGAINEKF